MLWMSDPLARALREWFPGDVTTPRSAAELIDAPSGSAPLVFLDRTTIEALDGVASQRGLAVSELTLCGPVIAICDGALQSGLGWMAERPWLSHVMCAELLSHPIAPPHIEHVVSTLVRGSRARLLDWVRNSLNGRRIWLTHASERVERLERMGEFLDEQGVCAHSKQLLVHAAGELLARAFYDAPLAAGAFSHPISRAIDVSLPEDTAAGIVYGCTEDLAIVHVRDPFGVLPRALLFGPASEAWWQIMATASIGAIAVAEHHHTDYLVAIAKRDEAQPRPLAFHLFSKASSKRRFWKLAQDDSLTTMTAATFVSTNGSVGET
jgi:hypothetical protein